MPAESNVAGIFGGIVYCIDIDVKKQIKIGVTMDHNTQIRQHLNGLAQTTKTGLVGLALLSLMPISQALAGEVTVTVGVKNANVCLGTASDPASFGAKNTKRSGRVTFHDVPAGRTQVTVSRKGYKSQTRKFTMSSSSSVHAPIREGVGGAKCLLASVQFPAVSTQKKQQNSYSLRLDRVSLNNGAGYAGAYTVKIYHQVQGKPTHYRASESPLFDDTDWQAYVPVPTIKLSAGKGSKTVYFQVRKTVAIGKGEIVRESTIASDNINIR